MDGDSVTPNVTKAGEWGTVHALWCTPIYPTLWGWEGLLGWDTGVVTDVSTQGLGEARVTSALAG